MKTIPVSLVVAGLLIPGILRAQPDTGEKDAPKGDGPPGGEVRPPRPPRDGEGRPKGPPRDGEDFGMGWKRADTNGDGVISRAEFDAMPRIQKLPEEKRARIFSRFDKNGDNQLSGDELEMMMERPMREGREAMKRFLELDTDHSGGISLEELKAGELFKKLPPEKQEALFSRLDTDGDGQITTKDRPGPPHGDDGHPPIDRPDHMEKGDHPDKERPDRGDRGPGRDPRRMIRDFDENHDGSLSFDEFRNAPPNKNLTEDEQEDRFEALDKNGDKKIDETDFPPPPDKPPGAPAKPPGEPPVSPSEPPPAPPAPKSE